MIAAVRGKIFASAPGRVAVDTGSGIILQLILINAIWLTGGSDGIPKIPSPWIGSLELKDPSKFFFVAAIMLILMTWASFWLPALQMY